MTVQKPNPITENTEQELENRSFDKVQNISARLLLLFDGTNNVPLNVNSSGEVRTQE